MEYAKYFSKNIKNIFSFRFTIVFFDDSSDGFQFPILSRFKSCCSSFNSAGENGQEATTTHHPIPETPEGGKDIQINLILLEFFKVLLSSS